MGADRYLPIYLNDHLAAATAEGELVGRIRGAHAGTPLGRAVEAMAGEIDADRDALREAMRAVGAGTDHAKRALAFVGEKAGRLKPNGHLVSRSPLSTLVEIEALCLLVEGRRQMWAALAAAGDRRMAAADAAARADRARAQREALEPHRLDAAGCLRAPS